MGDDTGAARADGDRVAAVVRYRARGWSSGVEIEGRESALWTFRDGKVVRYEWFHGPEDAFRAAGLKTLSRVVAVKAGGHQANRCSTRLRGSQASAFKTAAFRAKEHSANLAVARRKATGRDCCSTRNERLRLRPRQYGSLTDSKRRLTVPTKT